MKKVILGCVILALLSGCGANTRFRTQDNQGWIALEADEKGMRAFSDYTQGAIINGKASPNRKTSHTAMREMQEREQTTRETAPGFLAQVFAPLMSQPEMEK